MDAACHIGIISGDIIFCVSDIEIDRDNDYECNDPEHEEDFRLVRFSKTGLLIFFHALLLQ
jgi:hypothetical protein